MWRGMERGRGMERHRDSEWHGKVAEWVVPCSCVVDKNQEGYLRSEGSQPQMRLLSLGFQCQEDKSP